MKLLSALVGVLFVLTSSSASAAAGVRVVDLTGDFDRFAMTTAQMPDAQRVTAFEKRIGPMANGFYSRERRPQDYDFRVLGQLKTYPERREATLAVSRDFNRQFASARQQFESAFGPLPSSRPVYLIDSLGELDGGTRKLDGQSTLLFGADVIAEVHSGQNLEAFFYHEFFHLYHGATVTGCMAIWCSLWEEGMATYVASKLDPGASDDELVLNLPVPIRPAVEANRSRAVCAVVRRLDSTSDEDFDGLFQGDDRLPGFPSRMGYYIGYLVAADIGRTHDLHSMTKMRGVEARPLIDASLARMATCQTASAEAHERSRNYRSGG